MQTLYYKQHKQAITEVPGFSQRFSCLYSGIFLFFSL